MDDLPDIVFTLDAGQSCTFISCPFFKSCMGGELYLKRDSIFICNMKKLKKMYWGNNVRIHNKT